jgi:hypothetical protein
VSEWARSPELAVHDQTNAAASAAIKVEPISPAVPQSAATLAIFPII